MQIGHTYFLVVLGSAVLLRAARMLEILESQVGFGARYKANASAIATDPGCHNRRYACVN